MNLNFLKLKKFRRKHRSGGGVETPNIIQTMRHWMFAFAFAAMTFVFMSAYLGFDFYTQLEGSDEAWYGEMPTPTTYRAAEAKKILDIYRARGAEFKRLQNERSGYVVERGGEEEEAAPLAQPE